MPIICTKQRQRVGARKTGFFQNLGKEQVTHNPRSPPRSSTSPGQEGLSPWASSVRSPWLPQAGPLPRRKASKMLITGNQASEAMSLRTAHRPHFSVDMLYWNGAPHLQPPGAWEENLMLKSQQEKCHQHCEVKRHIVKGAKPL